MRHHISTRVYRVQSLADNWVEVTLDSGVTMKIDDVKDAPLVGENVSIVVSWGDDYQACVLPFVKREGNRTTRTGPL